MYVWHNRMMHIVYLSLFIWNSYFKLGHKLRRLLTGQLRGLRVSRAVNTYMISDTEPSWWRMTSIGVRWHRLPPSLPSSSYCVIFLTMIGSKLSPLLLRMCSYVTQISGLLPTVHTANVLLVSKPGADFTWCHHITHIPEWNTCQSPTGTLIHSFWLCSKLLVERHFSFLLRNGKGWANTVYVLLWLVLISVCSVFGYQFKTIDLQRRYI